MNLLRRQKWIEWQYNQFITVNSININYDYNINKIFIVRTDSNVNKRFLTPKFILRMHLYLKIGHKNISFQTTYSKQ